VQRTGYFPESHFNLILKKLTFLGLQLEIEITESVKHIPQITKSILK
jgi:hypothetical protein